MRLREGGREHDTGNPACAACDQTAPGGDALSYGNVSYVGGKVVQRPDRYPLACAACKQGLVHAEVFDEPNGAEVIHRCDHCGGTL